MLNIDTLKIGDRVRARSRFSLVQEGVVKEIHVKDGRLVIQPTKADDMVNNLTVYPSGYQLYEAV